VAIRFLREVRLQTVFILGIAIGVGVIVFMSAMLADSSIDLDTEVSNVLSIFECHALRSGHVWSIRTTLQMAGRKRDLALFNVAIGSKLRDGHSLRCPAPALRLSAR
jgi:hypothetical protein